MSQKYGTLPAEWIRSAISAGVIIGAHDTCVQPASLDLTVNEVYRVRAVALPKAGQPVSDLAATLDAVLHTGPLERGVVYLVKLGQRLDLLPSLQATANPKSTTGRLDLYVRLVVDGFPRFDTVPQGYVGELWAFVVSQTFAIFAPHSTPLTQLRFSNSDTSLSETELQLATREFQLLWTSHGDPVSSIAKLSDGDGTLILTIDLESEIIGWRGDPCGPIIDMSKVGEYDTEEFFTPMRFSKGHLLMRRNSFYILSTREWVRVPPTLSCEMHPMDSRSGEFRAHYAGFIDPGWGWGVSGEGKGRPLTLEVRPHEDILVGVGQPIAKIGFSRMAAVPQVNYDAGASNYREQRGPQLAKQFRPAA